MNIEKKERTSYMVGDKEFKTHAEAAAHIEAEKLRPWLEEWMQENTKYNSSKRFASAVNSRMRLITAYIAHRIETDEKENGLFRVEE